jgi:hypothetical protein
MVSPGLCAHIGFRVHTQGPVLPWVYARFYGIVQAQGVLGARVLTAFFGLLACGLACGLAGRLAEPGWNASGRRRCSC